jgi:hypothetical protein
MGVAKCLFLFLFVLMSSCKEIKPNSATGPVMPNKIQNSPSQNPDEEFYNRINGPEVELPYVGHFRSERSMDTLDFEIFPDSVYRSEFTGYLYLRGDDARISFDQTTSITVYSEGDIDGNGTEEIGLMLGWHTSGCRDYSLKTYSHNKWREIANVGTHLPDRVKGIDYYKNEGNQIRIISANGDACCQCLQLDTTYRKIKPLGEKR